MIFCDPIMDNMRLIGANLSATCLQNTFNGFVVVSASRFQVDTGLRPTLVLPFLLFLSFLCLPLLILKM